MITKFNFYNINESDNYSLSGKHSFLIYLQIVSNHEFHFMLNEYYTDLYNYHFFFSTETIKDNNEFIDIFKHKHSLPSAFNILNNIKTQKLSFFFGVKDNSILRYGFVDLDTQRSYVVGEFQVSDVYFNTVAKYEAMQFINKMIQNVNIKNLATLSKIKKDFEKFYESKEKSKILINDNRVIKYINRNKFTDEDINMNRLFRSLDKWVSKRSWRNKVEYSVDDTKNPIEFIILVN